MSIARGTIMLLILTALLATAIPQASAEKEEQDLQLVCIAKAHMARATQEVRQTTRHDWVEFNVTAKKLYKFGEGLNNLIEVADFVYHYVPEDMHSGEVYDRIINACAIELMAIHAKELNEVYF